MEKREHVIDIYREAVSNSYTCAYYKPLHEPSRFSGPRLQPAKPIAKFGTVEKECIAL